MPYHHYVSAFHLAHFTAEPRRGRRAVINELNLDTRRQYRTRVSRAGGEGAYNAVQGMSGLEPEAMEQLLERRYETAAAPVLRTVNETLVLPEGDGRRALLEYVALLSVNNPARRGAMNDAQERVLYSMAQMMIANPDTFEAVQARYRRDGVPLLGDVSYDELRAIVDRGSFEYTMPTVAHLRGMGNLVDHLVALLVERTWSLLIAPHGAPEFICGDRPVVLTWTSERRRELELAAEGQPIFPPGFASPDTELIVPLGRCVALLGVFGGEPRRLLGDRDVVAEVNGRMLGHATRLVYSAEPMFIFRDDRNVIRESFVLLEAS